MPRRLSMGRVSLSHWSQLWPVVLCGQGCGQHTTRVTEYGRGSVARQTLLLRPAASPVAARSVESLRRSPQLGTVTARCVGFCTQPHIRPLSRCTLCIGLYGHIASSLITACYPHLPDLHIQQKTYKHNPLTCRAFYRDSALWYELVVDELERLSVNWSACRLPLLELLLCWGGRSV